jgi:hypothetical protein
MLGTSDLYSSLRHAGHCLILDLPPTVLQPLHCPEACCCLPRRNGTENGGRKQQWRGVNNGRIPNSSNGDRWYLAQDSATDEPYVLRRANPSSGGHEIRTPVEVFLNIRPFGPEREALMDYWRRRNGAAACHSSTRKQQRISTEHGTVRPLNQSDGRRSGMLPYQLYRRGETPTVRSL